ncbi:MAG: amino acid permease [Bacteroidetes bacterium]|nr:amino acid permease [Bacteroidota bacterium]
MNEKNEFTATLGLLDSTTIVIGSMIGSGIFIVSSDMARILGSPGWLLIAWIVTGIVTVVAALSYGELASMMPRAGGQYVYLKEAYNPMMGFLYGWTLFAVIQTGTIAAVAIAFAKFTGVIFSWCSPDIWIFKIGTFCPYHLPFGIMGPYHVGLNNQNLIAIISLFILTLVNARGLKGAKTVQNIFTFAKTLSLAGLILLGIFVGKNAEAIAANFSNFWTTQWSTSPLSTPGIGLSGFALLSALGAAMVGSLFSSDAWNNITFTAGEVKDPKRTIPLSLVTGTLTVTIIYVIANITYLLVIPLHGNPDGVTSAERGMQFALQDRVGVAASSMVFGESAAVIMALLIMISTFGCNNGLILAGARVYYAMAKDKLFFPGAASLNKFNVPQKGLFIQATWASVLCLTGTYNDMLDYVIFAVMMFYILTIGAIFILRRRKPNAERPYKAFGYPILPAIYILFAIAFCVNLLLIKPQFTWPGLIIVLTGVPIYFLWLKKTKGNK